MVYLFQKVILYVLMIEIGITENKFPKETIAKRYNIFHVKKGNTFDTNRSMHKNPGEDKR